MEIRRYRWLISVPRRIRPTTLLYEQITANLNHEVKILPYKINSIRPKDAKEIELGCLTVLVGPNNCGKSQTLKDIREYTNSGTNDRLTVLDQISVTLPSEEEFKTGIQIRPHENSADHINIVGVKDDLLSQISTGLHRNWFEQTFSNDLDLVRKKTEILRPLGTCLIAYLGAEARFKITESSIAFNPRAEVPSNALQSLFASEKDVFSELRQAFKSAFEMDIGLDWAAMTRLYLRVAPDFGEVPDTRNDLDALMSDAVELAKQGDGFRSLSGIALASLTYPNRVLLLDEPEAFLHPAQARVLGRWLAKQSLKRQGQIIVATHSADFLAGLVSAGEEAKILRLNRTGMNTSFHEIPPAAAAGLIESPLLSSQPVLDALFHRGVVICEGDPDRAVYQTTAHLSTLGQRGDEFLFIHSNGKDAAKFPAELFRESGTPVCVIVDFDALCSQATLEELVRGLTANGLNENDKKLQTEVCALIETKSQEQSLGELLTKVAAWLENPDEDLRRARRSLVASARAGSNKWDRAKKIGISALPEVEKFKASALIQNLASAGLFVVPCGELESWFDLGVSKGSKWNQLALQALHENRKPPDLDDFVNRVLIFLSSGQRAIA